MKENGEENNMPCKWSFGPYCSLTYINNNVVKRTSNVASVMEEVAITKTAKL